MLAVVKPEFAKRMDPRCQAERLMMMIAPMAAALGSVAKRDGVAKLLAGQRPLDAGERSWKKQKNDRLTAQSKRSFGLDQSVGGTARLMPA